MNQTPTFIKETTNCCLCKRFACESRFLQNQWENKRKQKTLPSQTPQCPCSELRATFDEFVYLNLYHHGASLFSPCMLQRQCGLNGASPNRVSHEYSSEAQGPLRLCSSAEVDNWPWRGSFGYTEDVPVQLYTKFQRWVMWSYHLESSCTRINYPGFVFFSNSPSAGQLLGQHKGAIVLTN